MIIQRFAFWNPGTWQIPKLYWDAFSDEQRIHAICKQLGKVIAYADYLGINVDDIAERLKAIEEGQLDQFIVDAIEEWFNENQPEIMNALQALDDALPISEFSAANTVKDALNTVNARFPVGTSDIADESVTNGKIADDAVTTDKIADESVTEDKINPAFLDKIEKIRETNYISNTITPVYVGDFISELHTQGMTYYDGAFYQGLFDENIGTYIQGCDIANNNFLARIQRDDFKHCNSIAYDATRDKMWITTLESLYQADTDFSNYGIFSAGVPSGVAYAVGYDYITEAVYLFTSPTGNLYKMEANENAFTLVGHVDIRGAQDIAVYNDILYIINTKRDLYTFDVATLQALDMCTLDTTDTSGKWYFTEAEGLTFDEEGHLFVSFTSGGRSMQSGIAITSLIFNIPILNKIYATSQGTFFRTSVLNLTIATQAKFKLELDEIRSLAQMGMIDAKSIRAVTIGAANETLNDPYPALFFSGCRIAIAANATVNCASWQFNNGVFSISLASTATLNFNKESGSGAILITNAATFIILYLAGTVSYSAYTNLLNESSGAMNIIVTQNLGANTATLNNTTLAQGKLYVGTTAYN